MTKGRQNLMIGLVMLILVTLTGLAMYTPEPPQAVKRIPVLDDLELLAWVDSNLALVQSTNASTVFSLANLDTGQRVALPSLPSLPRDKQQGNGVIESYVRSYASLSANKEWLLFEESQNRGGRGSGAEICIGRRWRRVNLLDGSSSLWPSDGAFYPLQQRTDKRRILSATEWLPDSSGWVTLDQQSDKTLSLTRFDLTSRTPKTLRSPQVQPGYEFWRFLPNGQGVFSLPEQDRSLSLYSSLRSDPIKLQLLPLLPNSPTEIHDSATLLRESRSCTLVACDEEALLVVVPVVQQDPARLFATFLPQYSTPSQELWCLPRRGGAPKRLRVLAFYASGFTLSADHNFLFYWQGNGEKQVAYRVPLR